MLKTVQATRFFLLPDFFRHSNITFNTPPSPITDFFGFHWFNMDAVSTPKIKQSLPLYFFSKSNRSSLTLSFLNVTSSLVILSDIFSPPFRDIGEFLCPRFFVLEPRDGSLDKFAGLLISTEPTLKPSAWDNQNFPCPVFLKASDHYLIVKHIAVLHLVSNGVGPALDDARLKYACAGFPITQGQLAIKFATPICCTGIVHRTVVKGSFCLNCLKLYRFN